MARQKISPYSNIVFPNIDRLEIERKLTVEVKELREENEKLKNTLKNIRFYLVDKTCNLIKIIQTAGDNKDVVADLIVKEEAYSDILVYLERKGIG